MRAGYKLVALLANAGGLAHAIAEVVELGATNVAVTDNLELGNLGAVQREGALNAHGEANLADGEGLASTLAAHADDVALEDLLTSAVALDDAIVDLDVVANLDCGDVLANLLTLDGADVIHVHTSFFSRGADARANDT